MMLYPLPRVYCTGGNDAKRSAGSSSHLGHFALVLSNIDSHQDSQNKSTTGLRDRPKLSLSLGYGRDSNAWFYFPRNGVYLPDIDATRDEVKETSACSTSLKMDVKQQLSNSQAFHSFIKYRQCQFRQTLSLGTMFTRTLSSSRLSRLGVGIRHIFDNNIRDRVLWKQGKTWWLFQLERGDATFCIPVSIQPHTITSWETCVRLFYASLSSLIVDVIVGELFSGATSMIRVKFLQLLLGDYIGDEKIRESFLDRELTQHRDGERWKEQHLVKAQEDALKQKNSMHKQAECIAKREEDQRGLIIVKAVYGVMDNENREWVQKHSDSKQTSSSCTLDATVQLQFWVSDGRLHMPAASKKHMLGFYHVLDCLSDEDWDSLTTNEELDLHKELNIVQKFLGMCKRQLERPSKQKGGLRDLRVILSIRYKWEDMLFDVMFDDDEAVELPSPRANEVGLNELI
jgi:hypothetical protein